MLIRIRFLLLTIFCVYFSADLFSQRREMDQYDPTGSLGNAISSVFQAQHGPGYEIGYYQLDSMLVHRSKTRFNDRYGTLQGCTLFYAFHSDDNYSTEWSDDSTIVVGVFRNNQILWDNYPGSKGCFYSTLTAADDINRDGNIEFVGYCPYGNAYTGHDLSFIWILSWNGVSGQWINEIDESSGQSLLVTSCGWIDILDIEGNGTKSISGITSERWPELYPEKALPTEPDLLYYWTGVAYVRSNQPLVQGGFLPASKLSLNVDCHVDRNGTKYRYTYGIANRIESLQSAEKLLVGGMRSSPFCYFHPPDSLYPKKQSVVTSAEFSPLWWYAISTSLGSCLFACQSVSQKGLIWPGEKKEGFCNNSISPPMIVHYWGVGYTGYWPQASAGAYANNILTNSVVGFTIGPYDTTQPFTPQDYLDTLSNWYHQADTLGWFKDHATAQKYIDIVSSLRTALQQDDRLQVFDIARQALAGVDADSSGHMTSEAYALVRYCLEYFVTHVPAVATVPPPEAIISSASQTFSWRSVPTAATYDLQISTDSAFAAPEFSISGITDTTTTVTGLGINTTYYWRVSAHVSVGPAGWSPVRTLLGDKKGL